LLASFEKERDRLDGMMSGRGAAIARMSDATGGPLQVTNR
jgi:endonuclease/exonuclease/phosphatase family metal-dependent hydrolase